MISIFFTTIPKQLTIEEETLQKAQKITKKINKNTAKKTGREKAFDQFLIQLPKHEQKSSIAQLLRHNKKKMAIIKKDLDQAKKLAKEKGPYSYEAEVRVPEKKEAYLRYKRQNTDLKKKLDRLKLKKKVRKG